MPRGVARDMKPLGDLVEVHADMVKLLDQRGVGVIMRSNLNRFCPAKSHLPRQRINAYSHRRRFV